MVASNRSSDIRRAIDKLIDIHVDISKMLAVHDQRLNQHEKTHSILAEDVEKRRLELHSTTIELYKALDEKTKDIMQELDKNADRSTTQHNRLNEKITSLSRYIWTGIGVSIGISILVSVVSVIANTVHLFK
jgi:hypothetical protein